MTTRSKQNPLRKLPLSMHPVELSLVQDIVKTMHLSAAPGLMDDLPLRCEEIVPWNSFGLEPFGYLVLVPGKIDQYILFFEAFHDTLISQGDLFETITKLAFVCTNEEIDIFLLLFRLG